MEKSYNLVVDVVANILGRPARIFVVPVVKGKGVDVWSDLVRVAVAVGVLEQRGSWYYYEKVAVAQGEESVARLLEENREEGMVVMENTLRVIRGEGT
jgi:hypothetical protein